VGKENVLIPEPFSSIQRLSLLIAMSFWIAFYLIGRKAQAPAGRGEEGLKASRSGINMDHG
jgi:hypothetical protein